MNTLDRDRESILVHVRRIELAEIEFRMCAELIDDPLRDRESVDAWDGKDGRGSAFITLVRGRMALRAL